MYPVKVAFAGCAIFDPLLTIQLSDAMCEAMIDKLALFGFPQFIDPDFMTRLKAELPKLKKHMNMAYMYDWDMVEGAVEYNADLARKNSLRQGNDSSRVPHVETWKDDVAECARRIWLWWRERSRAKLALPTFVEAVRLVVLVPPSSAAAERAFSQLKLILEVVGNQPKEDNVECRMHVRCNKNKLQ